MTNTMKQEQHKKHLWVFREVQGVDQTLCKQIVTAIEPQYLEAFWDTAIGRINIPVHTLITQLYQLYDCITPQKLQEQEDMISQMEYDLVHPIDGVLLPSMNVCIMLMQQAVHIHRHRSSIWPTLYSTRPGIFVNGFWIGIPRSKYRRLGPTSRFISGRHIINSTKPHLSSISTNSIPCQYCQGFPC